MPVRNLPKLFYETEVYEDSARVIFEEHYFKQCIKNPYLYDGVEETLEKLLACGIKLSVATNAPTKFAKRMLTHLKISDKFDVIIGAGKLTAPKPEPQMINEILDYYNFDKQKHKAWMVGDNSIAPTNLCCNATITTEQPCAWLSSSMSWISDGIMMPSIRIKRVLPTCTDSPFTCTRIP